MISQDEGSADEGSARVGRGWQGLARVAVLTPVLFLTLSHPFSPLLTPALAESASAELLALGRVEYFTHRGQWEAAAAELGRLSKASQESAAMKQYLNTVVAHLYEPARPAATRAAARVPPKKPPAAKGPRITTQSRVTHRHRDAERRSDRTSDERGWEYNNAWMLEADAGGVRHVLRGAVDGYQDGKNDLRPRQFSYQARREGVQLTVGDVRNYLTRHKVFDPVNPLTGYTGYTLRSTQLRGVDVQWATERNDLHLMAGVAPYFLSPSDETIYPRQLYGVRESHRFAPWYRAAVGASYVRDDDERQTHIDPVIQPRETSILAFEQDLTLVPDHWEINTESAYSVTDDNLRPDGRFGQNVKLKDFAHHLYSEWRWPAIRAIGTYERIGPDFRAPSDIAAIGTVNSKNVSADREHVSLRVYPRRMGALYGDLLYARSRNNLDDDSAVGMTREHWVTAQGGLELPTGLPQPGVRATFTRSVSVPGTRFSPNARWIYDLDTELRKRWWETEWIGGFQYGQTANDEGTGFDDEYRRSWRLHAGRALWPGGFLSTRGAWARVQDRFDNTTMRRRTEQEVNITVSSRLWGAATLSAGYSYQDLGAPIVVDPGLVAPTGGRVQGGGIIRTVSSTFLWPVTKRFRHGRKLQLTPAISFHTADASDDLEQHPSIGARLTARYDVRDDWRWEFMLEHHQDDDQELSGARSQDWRAWLLVTSKFGPPIADDSPLR